MGYKGRIIFKCQTHLLEAYNPLAPPSSSDGDPAPERELPGILPVEVILPDNPKDDLIEEDPEASVGDVVAVDEPERGWLVLDGGGR